MKKSILLTFLRVLCGAALVSGGLHPVGVSAQPSQYMTYQGYLTDGNGNPLGTTNTGPKAYDVVFRVWDVPTGGASSDEVHAEVQTVTVDNGYFSVLLGQGLRYLSEPFAAPLSSIFTNTTAARYMEITVQGIGVSGANITILPRLQLVSAPYAYLAANAQNVTGNGVITAGNIAPNAITGANIALGTVTDANMVPGTLTHASLAAGTIIGADIAPNTITGGNIAANSITGGNIASGAISGSTIAANTITGGNIASGTIPGSAIANNTISAGNLNSSIGVWTSSGSDVYRNIGSVGIGTTSPSAILDVEGYAYTTNITGPFFYPSSGSALGSFNKTQQFVSVKSQWYVLAYGFIAQSDRRIKDIVGQSDPSKDLATIQRLKVTDYRMKNRIEAGDTVHKGFIAQEVQSVMPEAVNKSREYIPNIYVIADKLNFDSGAQTLSVGLSKAHDLKKGDKVRLIEDSATLEREVLATPNDRTFVVGQIAKAPSRLFVFGKQVDDFLSVDYNRIFSTGIGAMQELAVRVEKLEARQAQMAELEQKVARMGKVEQELAELKQSIAQLSAARKTTREAAAKGEGSLIAGDLSR